MTDAAKMTRRTVLTIGSTGAIGSALVLAGCTPSSPSDSSTAANPPTSPAEVETDAPSAGGSAPDAPALGEDVAALADVPVGGSIDATINGEPALVAQPTAGQVVAFSAICTHQQCVVAAAGDEFHCPCHGSTYDAATGDVLNGPARNPLPRIDVAVSGNRIVAAS
ncbi:MAG TPA: Rieske (2Fe-2S) protein [Agromyces sp.]|jgi:Rieske Fe-S protein